MCLCARMKEYCNRTAHTGSALQPAQALMHSGCPHVQAQRLEILFHLATPCTLVFCINDRFPKCPMSTRVPALEQDRCYFHQPRCPPGLSTLNLLPEKVEGDDAILFHCGVCEEPCHTCPTCSGLPRASAPRWENKARIFTKWACSWHAARLNTDVVGECMGDPRFSAEGLFVRQDRMHLRRVVVLCPIDGTLAKDLQPKAATKFFPTKHEDTQARSTTPWRQHPRLSMIQLLGVQVCSGLEGNMLSKTPP